MPEGSAKSKLQKALVQAKKGPDSPTKEKDSDANAANIVDLVAQLKKNSKGYVFTYQGKASKADPEVLDEAKVDSDSDADDRTHQNALAVRMEQSASLKRKASRTMEMLMSNCLQNAFLFWKGDCPLGHLTWKRSNCLFATE